MAKSKASSKGASWLTGRGDVGMSLVLVAPLLFVYEIGVLFTGRMNGADLITRFILRLCGGNQLTYVAVHFTLALGFVIWLWRRGKRQPFQSRVMVMLMIESAIYAASLAAIINLALSGLGLGVNLGIGLGIGAAAENFILAIGAGVHEELVFRLLLLSGIATMLVRTGHGRSTSIALAFIVSSVVFAGVHHIGALGEPFTLQAFLFRTGAGLLLGAIYWWRSLAHAVYAHALYDIFVMVIIGAA